jgi:ectoine hydroxylase-related dioxygenase (phytanoyl-CoA dioxygenase family)
MNGQAINWDAKRRQLIEEGYCLVENLITSAEVEELREVTEHLIAQMSEEEARRQRSTGSLIPVVNDQRLAQLIAHPKAMGALEAMGFRDNRFQSGYIISKPPQSPPLFWHFDWGFWNHPISYEPTPVQLFLMYYLTDTTRANGCLRVIPGSHMRETPLHKVIADAHSEDLSQAKDLSRVEFHEQPGEIDVKVKAGDLVIGDSRIMHAAHANVSGQRRTVVTLWFHPNYQDMPEELQAAFETRKDPVPPGWSPESLRLLDSVLINYQGKTEPVKFSRKRLSREEAQKRWVQRA